nr:hypothetical protein [Clostridiales bacterium]
NQVTVYQGAELNPDDVRRFEDEIISSDILLLTNEVPQEVNSAAVSVAAANGVKVILNPAPSRELPPEMIGKVWLFTPNEFETNGLDGMSNVITTLGKNGCRIERTGEVIPSYTYGDTVDTTGAGDTFSGVLAACLASGDTLENSCRIACIAAGIEVTSKGVMDAIPYRDLINKAMKRDIDFKK